MQEKPRKTHQIFRKMGSLRKDPTKIYHCEICYQEFKKFFKPKNFQRQTRPQITYKVSE